ncbi:hypothetical protein PoMZ_08610 [Pyricularia oryzae]|uniref:Uncharacterized protein n=1 Tax=Pyricularia oryzae TaxID=318829 RepID=A0A4P7NIA2_PYROR|nr:hypothetical protein PoMZ_08610 [Pyricularia oryzae]
MSLDPAPGTVVVFGQRRLNRSIRPSKVIKPSHSFGLNINVRLSYSIDSSVSLDARHGLR